MIHSVKVNPEYFDDLLMQEKRFEVRKNDRNYKEGDYIALNEWVEENKKYTGRALLFKITYILEDKQYCKENYAILGLKACNINCVEEIADLRIWIF